MKKNLLFATLLISGASFGQVLSEDFEGIAPGLPTGWTSSTLAAGEWTTGDEADAGSAGFWPVPAHTDFAQANDDLCNCDMSAVYLTTPTMDLTGLSGVMLTFDAYEDGAYSQNPYSVELSVDGGATWANIFTGNIDNTQWLSEAVALGASADGQSAVQIRFKYDDAGNWASGSAIDNVVVKEPTADDAALAGVALPRYAATNSNLPLDMSVTNVGANTITSITVDWNDGAAHSQNITVNIAPGASANVSHPDLVTYAAAVEKSIDVTITQVNGGADSDPSNNAAATMLHNTVSTIIPKKVVIEEGTGTWCGWCPRGAVAMDYMTTTYPSDFIGIAVHNGDPMTVPAYDSGASFGGFPSSNVDRSLLDASVSTNNFEIYYNDRVGMIVPAGLAINVSGTGANAIIDVDATFYTPFAAANYRIAVVIVEDGVTGTTSGYNQVNYYSGGGSGVMGGYENLADPVPAADMVYDHVGRELLGGYNGQVGSVPATISDLTVASQNFTYTVPGTSVRSNMHAVALLVDQTNGEIVSAESVTLAEAGINELDAANVVVFPNPATDLLNIHFDANNNDYTINIIDLQGRTVANEVISNASGQQYIAIPVAHLAKGSYMVRISTGTASSTQNVVIK